MEPLVTQPAREALAALFEHAMETDVDIYARTTERNYLAWDDSSHESEQFVTTPVRVKGWLREMPDYQTDDELGRIVHTEDARLHVPLGTIVERGDKVVIAGNEYSVIDDNRHNTYRVAVRVALRRSA